MLGVDAGAAGTGASAAGAEAGAAGLAGPPPSSSRTPACALGARIWELAARVRIKKLVAGSWNLGNQDIREDLEKRDVGCGMKIMVKSINSRGGAETQSGDENQAVVDSTGKSA